MVIAANVKNIVRNNEAAKAWLNVNVALFCGLVVLTGGCYPALALCSSNIFGLELFSSGLTQHELGKLSKIKVLSTVVIENVPQLIFQALYSYAINDLTQAVAIAFFASILSVTASTLSYLIDRDAADVEAVHYYLSIECQRGTKSSYNPQKATGAANVGIGITDEEKNKLINNRGKTRVLGSQLTSLFCIQPKNLEIGSTMITKYGGVTHLVQFVSNTDLDLMEDHLHSTGIQYTLLRHSYKSCIIYMHC